MRSMQLDNALGWQAPHLGSPTRTAEVFRAHVEFELKQSRYIIKTAQTQAEFEQVIALRTAVFLEEFAGKDPSHLRDIEDRDLTSDFIIIKDAVSQEVLGSYRMICSQFSQDFYSQSEFEIDDFLDRPGIKLELSRACVRADKRSSGIFVHLLWRGISEYVQRCGARYLFGCSSIQSLDLRQLLGIYRYLRGEGSWGTDFSVRPHPAYHVLDLEGILSVGKPDAMPVSERNIPPLLMGYLRAGARVYGGPAYDEDFGCLDLFTVLDFERLSEAHSRKYMQTA